MRAKAILAAGVLCAALAAPSAQAASTVDVQLLGINDFHGALEPPGGSGGRIFDPAIGANVNAGGVEYLATHVKALEATNPNTVVVGAGDLIGATPLLSSLFHDEPTIEAMNAIGMDVTAVGNHEFDEGTKELRRMQYGGCHPVDGCQDGDGFAGADFKYLSANVKLKEPTPYRSTFFDATKIKSFAGGRVGFIGLTLEDTPTIVSASGIRDVEFRDEAETINHLVGYLHSKGVKTIVVLIHEGGLPTGTYNECPGISGPIVDIVKNTDPEVDLFITGHTHQAYNCLIDGRPVTSASSNGRLITDVDMTIDKRTQQPTKIAVNNKIVTRDVPKDAGETNLIAKYQTFAAPIANRVVGSNTADITRTPSAAGEQPLGDVIADSQLASTAGPAGAQIAFMNPGGIRADLTYASSPAGEGDGIITYGEVFTIQPFGNVLTTLTLTGAQIEQVLEQQWGGSQPAEGRILQVSKGFTYTWDASKAPGDRIDPASIKLDGTTVDPGASYRVTVNNFLADGGDNFTALKAGTDRQGGQVDVDAFEAYIKAHSPISPPPLDRITTVP